MSTGVSAGYTAESAARASLDGCLGSLAQAISEVLAEANLLPAEQGMEMFVGVGTGDVSSDGLIWRYGLAAPARHNGHLNPVPSQLVRRCD